MPDPTPYSDPPEWTRAYNAAIARGLPDFAACYEADASTFGDCRDPSPLDFDGWDDE